LEIHSKKLRNRAINIRKIDPVSKFAFANKDSYPHPADRENKNIRLIKEVNNKFKEYNFK